MVDELEIPKSQMATCTKCGQSEFTYDAYWNEYTCEHCGWITAGDKVESPAEREHEPVSEQKNEPDASTPDASVNAHSSSDQTGKRTSVTFEHPVSFESIASGILDIVLAFCVLIILEKVNRTVAIEKNVVWILGSLAVAMFLINKLIHRAFRSFNLLRMKSITFESNGIHFIYKRRPIHMTAVRSVETNVFTFTIAGELDNGESIQLSVPRGFFKSRKERRFFRGLLDKYKGGVPGG